MNNCSPKNSNSSPCLSNNCPSPSSSRQAPDSNATDESRREFLGRTATAFAGVAVALAAPGSVSAFAAEGATELASAPTADAGAAAAAAVYDPTKHRYVFLVDVNKCIGCGECVRACEIENDVPEHYFRTWIERYEISRTGESTIDSPNGGRDGFTETVTGADITKAFFVPKLCNHCTSTPCVQLCPVGASFQSPDGVILVDDERCIGCGYCVQACPYGSRFIHPKTHVATKCTFCYHRITKGLQTACVEACPVNARMLGDAMNPDDEVSNIIATQQVQVLRPELLTEPNCHYLGFTKEIR